MFAFTWPFRSVTTVSPLRRSNRPISKSFAVMKALAPYSMGMPRSAVSTTSLSSLDDLKAMLLIALLAGKAFSPVSVTTSVPAANGPGVSTVGRPAWCRGRTRSGRRC